MPPPPLCPLSLHDALPICQADVVQALHQPPAGVVVDGEGGDHVPAGDGLVLQVHGDRKSTRLNSSHVATAYAVFCLKKKLDIARGGEAHKLTCEPAAQKNN